jgi:hypothetical protein
VCGILTRKERKGLVLEPALKGMLQVELTRRVNYLASTDGDSPFQQCAYLGSWPLLEGTLNDFLFFASLVVSLALSSYLGVDSAKCF